MGTINRIDMYILYLIIISINIKFLWEMLHILCWCMTTITMVLSLFTYIIIRNPLTNLPLHTHTVQYVVLDVWNTQYILSVYSMLYIIFPNGDFCWICVHKLNKLCRKVYLINLWNIIEGKPICVITFLILYCVYNSDPWRLLIHVDELYSQFRPW